MPLRANRLRETAREALPYFVKAWGTSDEDSRVGDGKGPLPEGEPKWVQWLEREIRSKVEPEHPAKRLYATIIQSLLELAAPSRATDSRRSDHPAPAVNGVPETESGPNKTPGSEHVSDPLHSEQQGVLFRPAEWARTPTDDESVETVSRAAMRSIVKTCLKKHISETDGT